MFYLIQVCESNALKDYRKVKLIQSKYFQMLHTLEWEDSFSSSNYFYCVDCFW